MFSSLPHKRMGAASGEPLAVPARPYGPLDLDGVDPQRGEGLPVPTRPAVVLPLLVLEDPDLAVPTLLQHRAHHLGLVHERGAQTSLAVPVPADQEDLAQDHLLAGLGGDRFQMDGVALLHPVLLAAGPDDRVHLSLLRPTCRNERSYHAGGASVNARGCGCGG